MKLPKALSEANERVGDWLNITLYYRGGWLDIRVLDIVMFIGGAFCVGWYYFTQGWLGAAQAGMLYLFIVLCVMWFFPSRKEMK